MKIMKIITTFFILMNVASATCCNHSAASDIKIDQPIVRPAQKDKNTAAYMSVKLGCDNGTDKLLKAECEASRTTELHNHINDNGIMRMRPVDSVEIHNGELTFKPGGLHVMLMGLNRDLKEGEIIKIKLTFENAGPVEIDYTVKNPD